ncbi:MAG: c-type cytochrome [Actinobacteria bacterium]|nr:c-type cytochrome [Actinomycetota bacterium]
MILGTVQSSIGYIVLFLVCLLCVVYGIASIRSGKRAAGSEVALAPNRKPYYDNQTLETTRLNRVLVICFATLAAISLILPLYWLAEPGRMDGWVEHYNDTFVKTGGKLFAANNKDNPDGLGCADCHGASATGGVAKYTITDADGRFIKQVSWQAPALDTAALRFNRAQLREIITYGRPFSPMAGWGAAGGGSENAQSIEDIISYLESIQISPAKAQQQVQQGLKAEKAAAAAAGKPYTSDGQALFNLGYYSGFAGGAYSCGRCHTQGWSYGDKGPDGDGAYGPNLTDTTGQFPGATAGVVSMVNFVCQGSMMGAQYGVHGLGTGRMPAFCQTKAYNPNTDELASQLNVPSQDQGAPGSGMMTQADVAEIVRYVRGL